MKSVGELVAEDWRQASETQSSALGPTLIHGRDFL